MSLLKERLAAVMKFYGINKIQLCTILEVSPDLLTKACRFQRTLSSKVNLKIYELESGYSQKDTIAYKLLTQLVLY
jgi:hypothetical protein